MPVPSMLSSDRAKLFTDKKIIIIITIHGEIGQARVKRDTAKLDKHDQSAAGS